jgi:hypothetical protein
MNQDASALLSGRFDPSTRTGYQVPERVVSIIADIGQIESVDQSKLPFRLSDVHLDIAVSGRRTESIGRMTIHWVAVRRTVDQALSNRDYVSDANRTQHARIAGVFPVN